MNGYGTDKHFDRLTEVVDFSYRQQRSDREIHQIVIEYLKGEYYPRGSMRDKVPQTAINLLSMAFRALSRYTISKAPRVLVNTADPQLKSWAENGEIAVNKRIERSNLAEEMAEVARQSMVSYGTFFLGPMFVGTPNGMKLDLEMKAIARPDHVHDMTSLTLEDSDIQGHKMRLPVMDVRDNPLFDEYARSKVEMDGGPNEDGDSVKGNWDRLFGRRAELYDYVDIWCIYERRRNKLIYYPRVNRDLKLLELDWEGPRQGPYRYLWYERPPNHATPISPLLHLIKKHKAFNALDIKAIHQQQVEKGLLLYTNASKEEAKTMLSAVDNQSVLQENGSVRWAHVGGASPDTVAMAEKQKRDFSYAAGNLDQYMGLSSQADTLGQERLLAGATNSMLEDMSGYAQKFVRGVCEDIFWFDLRDPDPEAVQLRKSIPGTELTYRVEWTSEHRQIAAQMEFEIDVEPYSYVERSPQSRLADLLGALQIIMGMGDMMVAQGISVDVEAVVRTIAKYKDLPELYDVLILNQEPERLRQLLGSRDGTDPIGGDSPKKYIRESRSDGAGQEMEIMRMFGRSGEEQVA